MSVESVLVYSDEQAEDYLRRFEAAERFLAFDTETTGLRVRTGEDYGRTIQFSWRPWAEAVVFEMSDRWRPYIEEFFDRATEGLVGHNTRFDIHVMETFGFSVFDAFKPAEVHDTRFLARLYDERTETSLKPLSVRYLAADAADEQAKLKRAMRKYGWTWATVPINELVSYGGADAAYTGQLFDFLYPRIPYALDAYNREQEVSRVLFHMERNGVKVDEDLIARVEAEEEAAVETARARVQELVPGLNPNAAHQIKAALRERGYDLEDTTAATLKALVANQGDELAVAVLAYREHQKTLSTYIRPWKGVAHKGRIHPSFNQVGTVTGRFSSEDPNLQNISKGHSLRDVFVADEGNVLVVADWNQMELRLYAHFAQDENMRAAFLSGDDIYQQVADLLDIPRQVGKMVMLASIYGAGVATLKRQCVSMAYKFGMADLVPDLLKYDWEDLHRKFHSQYRIRDLARLTELAARRRGQLGEAYITTLGGRRQRPKILTLPYETAQGTAYQRLETYKDLANSLVQGSSADLMKMSLVAVAEAGYIDALRLTVHDEMVLEVPEAEVEQVAEVLKRIMTRSEFTPPLTAEVSSARSYGQAK